jgi:carbon monoxide dehydrogenase subunit G
MRTWYDAEIDQPIDAVWSSLTDVDSVLAALPGAALAREGDVATGSLKVRVAGSQITYRINARAEVGDAGFHTAVLAITGSEARGSGTLAASLTVALRNDAGVARIEVSGDIEATGRGGGADDRAWRRVIRSLVNAVVPPSAPAPAAPAAAPPRPPLAVAPAPVPEVPDRRASPAAPVAIGVILLVMLLLLRRLRRNRRG